MLTSTNPATGEQFATYEEHTADEVVAFVEQADARQRGWRRTDLSERAAMLRGVADRLDARTDELAELMALEMGKPVTAGRGEVEKCAWVCRYYADHGEEHLADIPVDADRRRSYIHHEPLGIVLAVMPWNFPLWQVFRFAAPALMAGNAGLLKHASNVTGCSVAIEEVFVEGGAPEGLFRSLKIGSKQVASVLEHPLVRAATLTGSVPAGSAVAETAGRLLKKTVLELGGSDPYVVLTQAGAWHPPTVLTGVTPDMPAGEEELFGPVAAVLRARDEAHAIEIANDSAFGLGAAVFTADLERGERIAAEQLEAGCCFVNDFVASDPRLPFGGIKDSGYGRELSHLGIREFVNQKTVVVGPKQ